MFLLFISNGFVLRLLSFDIRLYLTWLKYYHRYNPETRRKEHYGDDDNRDASDYSNFIDLGWLSSSSSSCDELFDR